MNVLSLFDGMSCGRIALERAGIEVTNYFASEIDKYAIQISEKNYPDIIRLGDVIEWRDWKLPKIDLLIAGSPCQGFSVAGKGLNFDDPRSKLFFDFVDILKYYKPKYFLLENVRMKKECSNVITEILGVEPLEINSSLVSGQNRSRLYWTNIGPIETDLFGRRRSLIPQPEDRGILLKDILENNVDGHYFPPVELQKKSNGKMLNKNYISQANTIYSGDKFGTLCAGTHGYSSGYIRNHATCEAMKQVGSVGKGGQGNRVYSVNGKGATLSAQTGGRAGPAASLIQVGEASDIRGNESSTTMQGGHRQPKVAVDNYYYRKLTPLECERLQTVPDNYTEKGHTLIISNSQRYKMIGNGWTIDVVSFIFGYIK